MTTQQLEDLSFRAQTEKLRVRRVRNYERYFFEIPEKDIDEIAFLSFFQNKEKTFVIFLGLV